MPRKTIIGVMGGNESVGALASDARLVGAAICRFGHVLLTGGRCIDNSDIKNASMTGAAEAEMRPCLIARLVGARSATVARLIGICPEGPRRWDDTKSHRLFLDTALGSAERDVINGVTPDVLIFFAGSCGTLCELSFAVLAKKPLLFWNAMEILTSKYILHTTKDKELDHFLTLALNACRQKLGLVSEVTVATTVSSLKRGLEDVLHHSVDFSGIISDLVLESVRQAGVPTELTGFPGFTDEPNSKTKFEQIVARLSM